MNAEAKKRLLDALSACAAIRQFTKHADFPAFESSLLLRSAVERQLEILGEALGKAAESEPDMEMQLPELRRIVGLRNRIIHGYDSVDDEIVWDIAQTKMEPLERMLQRVLDERP